MAPTLTAAPARPALPTIKQHADACPQSDDRQEVWVSDLHAADGSITGHTGVAHCQDCGRVEKVALDQVQAVIAWRAQKETVHAG